MKVSIILLIAAVFVCAPQFVNANVKSISAATDTVNTKGDSFQTVQVTCERRSEKFVINRQTNSKKWCDSVLTNICHVNKIRLAADVCGRGYARFLAAKNIENVQQESIASKLETAVSKDARRLKLMSELLEIEKVRLVIAQRMFELQMRENELQKMKNELSSQLNN